ncbi:MAG TPA: hypothetical protein VH012_03530 [Acidimicrobiales bacterium]|jgi:hypothetical protein|nr:hypothetical protein [Acidimicrobiales bacterium]
MSDSSVEDTGQAGGWRGSLSRRSFLHRGAFTAGAVAVASSVPGLSSLIASTAPEAPAVDAGANEAADEGGALTEPLVAQVKDLTTGEISLFQGEREVVVRSPALARSLLSALQK